MNNDHCGKLTKTFSVKYYVYICFKENNLVKVTGDKVNCETDENSYSDKYQKNG